MLTDERSYCFHGLQSNYRTGDTHDVLEMLCAYRADISPSGELRRRITRVASTLVIRTEMPQDIFRGLADSRARGKEKAIAGPY